MTSLNESMEEGSEFDSKLLMDCERPSLAWLTCDMTNW